MYSIEKIETIEKRVEFIIIILVGIMFGLARDWYFTQIGIKVGQIDALLTLLASFILSFLLFNHFNK